MREPVGHVTVNERSPSQRFHRFVDEKIKMWLANHQQGQAANVSGTDEDAASQISEEQEAAEYEVAFFDEDSLGEISCLVVVHTGDQLWRSWETADNPRSALSRSLEHLRAESQDDNIPDLH